MKTMAIRLEEETSAQLTVLAQLENRTVTDLIREAITALIDAKRSQGDLAARAEAVLAEIDQEASARKSAIAGLFDRPATEPAAPEAPKSGRSRRNEPSG